MSGCRSFFCDCWNDDCRLSLFLDFLYRFLLLCDDWSLACCRNWGLDGFWAFESRWYLLLLSFFFFCMDSHSLISISGLTCAIIDLWNDSFLAESKVWNNFIPLFYCIIPFSSVTAIRVKISFEPLDKLQVVLVFGLDELFNLRFERICTSMCLLIPLFSKAVCRSLKLAKNSVSFLAFQLTL